MRRLALTLLIAVVVAMAAPAAVLDPPVINWQPPATYTLAASNHLGRTALTALAGPLPFIPVVPCRQTSASLPQATPRQVILSGLPCQIPSNAAAVALNITVYNITGATGNAVFNVGTASPPTTAWINYPPTEVQRGNAGVVPTLMLTGPPASAVIYVQVNQGAGSVSYALDIYGYYAPSGSIMGLNWTSNGAGTTSTPDNVSIGGNLTVTGNIAAKYQDVAEWVSSQQAVSAGAVLVLDREASNHVRASDHAYDTSVAGVVSPAPGLILGQGGPGKVMVATSGRVKVMTTARSGPIRIGDLLVTSSLPGVAMRSEPIQLGGVSFHRPGTIVGKALENLAEGQGEILVLLSLQ